MTDETTCEDRPSGHALDAWQLIRMRRLASDAGMWVAAIEQQLSTIDSDALAAGQTVTLETKAISAAIDAALAAGSDEAAYVLLAAQLLPTSTGQPALATALADDPESVRRWKRLTIGELLSAFRERPADLPTAICDRSRVNLADCWDSLDREELLRVSDACEALR